MPSVEKIIAKMKRQPNDISPQEADRALTASSLTGKKVLIASTSTKMAMFSRLPKKSLKSIRYGHP